MASNWSVTFAMALTTTNGRSGSRDFTMLATRSMAVASSTEVPPNFITIMAEHRRTAPTGLDSGRQEQALHFQKLGIQQSRAGRAANRVVREHGELPVEHAARTQTADADGHAIAAINVKPRLRTVGRGVVKRSDARAPRGSFNSCGVD